MRSLAIIPARGGSKRLKKKNLLSLGKLKLLEHTLIAAEKSKCFDKIILSSDDKNILSIGKKYKSVESLKRNKELAKDNTKALDLVVSILQSNNELQKYENISLLLPTCPFRNYKHIREAFKILYNSKADGVISVTEYEFPHNLNVKINNNFIKASTSLITGNTRSQDQTKIYRPNGGIYLNKMRNFLKNKNFWVGRILPLFMTRLDSIDIDEKIDLEYANFIYKKR